MIKYRKIIICILLSYALFIVGIFNVKALVYSNDVSYYNKTTNPMGYPNKKSISLQWPSANQVENMGVITWVFNTEYVTSCETDTCLIVIPYTAMVANKNQEDGNFDINLQINDFSFTTQVAHSSSNYYSACTNQDNNIECVVPNNQLLSSIDIIVNKTMFAVESRTTFEIQTLGFWYVYNMGQNTQAIQETADNTKDINESINDSSIDSNNTSSSVGGFSSSTNSSMNNTPVSSMISLPITFLTGVNNALSNSCTNVNYIELFNYQLVLPCLNLSERLGSVWTIIDTIFSCMLIFSIGKSLVSTFARLSDMDTNIMYECYANGSKHRGESFDD